MELQEAYVMGLEDGIRAYAWWKDGVQYVGTTGRTLGQALENARNGAYPPQRSMRRIPRYGRVSATELPAPWPRDWKAHADREAAVIVSKWDNGDMGYAAILDVVAFAWLQGAIFATHLDLAALETAKR